jgi:hypothetical protein
MARSITNPDAQASALADVAGALAQAKHFHQAEAMARSITNPDAQASALIRLADAMAQAGEGRSAARVTAALCTIAKWPTIVAPVLQLAPSAYATLASAWQEQHYRHQ